ncbi:MAG: hypothetical protein EA391_13905 [Balneolaceae bacterium]|nr:MAG: hypothetical protein EA391_13905 [Balneolaceae bacterium]
MKRTLIISLACLIPALLYAGDRSVLEEKLEEIKTGRMEIQNQTAAFLVVSRRLGAGDIDQERNIRVIKPVAHAYEGDLPNSAVMAYLQDGTLLPVLNKEGEWYKVRLPDTREGWIHQDDVQQLYDDTEKSSGRDNREMNAELYHKTRQAAELLFSQLSKKGKETDQLIAEFEEYYQSLSDAGKQRSAYLPVELNLERELINHSRAYAGHYYSKLPPIQMVRDIRDTGGSPIGFDGVASMRFGSSAYESGGEISETTRNLSLAGNMLFNPRSRLEMQLDHNNDVIRTPYNSTNVNLAHHYAAAGGTRLRTSFMYQNYEDELINQNSYYNLTAGVNVEHPVNPSTRFTGDLQAQSKSYDMVGGPDLDGVQFNTLLHYRGEKTVVNGGIRGRFQSSDVPFLDYQRINPNIRATFRTGRGDFTVFAEAEQLSYAAAAEINDYNRIRLDLERSVTGSRTQFSVISWQYPNNENIDNLRFRVSNQRTRSSAAGYSRTSMYGQYTYHTSDIAQLSNYADLRFDQNYSGTTGYFDIGAFGRYWEDEGRDHRLSIYSRFGYKISGIQLGPVVGADILIDPDDPDLKHTGNSYRAGVDGRANFIINQATVFSSVRYQQTFLYTGFTADGDSEMRKPTTLEVTAGARIPVAGQLELQIDVRYYSMDFDMPGLAGGAGNRVQSGLRFLTGVSYRFNRM